NQVDLGSGCACDKGFNLVDGAECKECSDGFFKAEVGNQTCTKCPDHSTCPNADRTGFSCDEGYSTFNNDCECDKGFTLVDDSCEMCDETYFKSTPGNFTCFACFLNSVSNDERTDCICKAGFGYKGFYSCDKCSPGTYKAEIGNGNCIDCLNNLVSNNERTDCACDAGFNLVGGACVECIKGSYKAEISNEKCTKCPDHSTCTETGRTNFSCDTGYSTDNNDCVCDAGFGHNGTDCEECSKDSFKAEIGNETCPGCELNVASCEECSKGYYKAKIGNDQCTRCPDHSTSNDDSTDC
ncbi:MAG: Ephrin type-A receptor 5, partial [Paramarteilia canceri]